MNFLQFLVFVQNLDYEERSLISSYRIIQFKITDFLRFQNPTSRSTNHYQVKKLVEFFEKFQQNLFIKFFSNISYRSIVIMPEVFLDKSRQNAWVVRASISESLFEYVHPFFIPEFFQPKITKYEFDVQLKIVQ